jgi:hypothetical protein
LADIPIEPERIQDHHDLGLALLCGGAGAHRDRIEADELREHGDRGRHAVHSDLVGTRHLRRERRGLAVAPPLPCAPAGKFSSPKSREKDHRGST